MIKKLCTAAVCFAAVAVGCSGDDTPPLQAPEADFELVWSDEFEGEAGLPPDQTRWTYDIGNGPDFDGYGNGQLEFTTDFADNVALDGLGNLVISAQDTPFFFDTQFTAGRVTTKDKLAVRYGRIEARMRLPPGKGIWPAFWMLGDSFPEVPWPGPGEIDIMEYRGQDPQAVFGSVHGPGFCGSPFVCAQGNISGTFRLDGLEGFDEDFHVFAIEWDESRITWFVDDDAYFTVTPNAVAAISGQWVFDQPFFLLLNLAVGGGFVMEPPDATTPFPASMIVDYVRVYKRVRGSSEPIEVIDIDDGTRDIPSPSAIEIDPDSLVLAVTGSQKLSATGDGETIVNGVVWSSSNDAAVRVGTSGVVYGIAVGTASVTAEIAGVSDTIVVTVSATVAPPNAEPLPLIVDNSHPGRSAFAGPPDGAPFHSEDGACPLRAGEERGDCHRFVWDGVNTRGGPAGFTGTFWTLGGGFDFLGRLFVQRGAAEVSFFAWGAQGGEKIEFGAGLPGFGDIGSDSSGVISLTTEPTRYTIPLVNLANYTTVVSPFSWTATNEAANGNPNGFTFYVDDIVWRRAPPPPADEPEVAAQTPTFDASNVISLFSDPYTDVPLTLADPDFDRGTVTVVELSAGENIRRVDYAGGDGNFAGIIFEGENSLDLTGFETVRFDVWAPTATQIRVNLVDFGADNAFDGGDDSNFEIIFDASTMPALANREWVTFDIPLTAFTGLASRANLSQIFLSVDDPAQTVFYDNILFYRTDPGSLDAPVTPAPTPTIDALNVISLFSDAYTDVPLTLADPDLDRGTVSVVELSAGENIRRVDYAGGGGNFAGITFEGENSLDLSTFESLRFDVWTPVATQIRVNLVDFGADNAFGGGDDSSFEQTFDASTTPALSNRQWVTFDIPLSSFTGLASLEHISQIFLSVDDPAQTVFYDNIIFYKTTVLTSLAVTPNPITASLGSLQQLTVAGTFDDSSTADVTSQATFSVDNANVSVDSSGVITANTVGTSSVTATIGGISAGVTVTVVPAEVTAADDDVVIYDQGGSPVFAPGGPAAGGDVFGEVDQGSSFVMPFVLPAVPTGGFTTANFSVQLQFTNDNGGGSMNGDLYGLPFRSAADAASGGVVLTSDGYVGAAVDSGATLLTRAFLTGSSPGSDTPIESDAGTDQAIVDYLNAQVAAGAVAGDYVYLRISPDVDYPTGAGTTWFIWASPDARAPTLTARGGLPPPTLTSVAITPSPLGLSTDGTQQLTVTGTFDDSSTSDVTAQATFASDNDTIATVTATGLVTGIAEGTANITATVNGLSATVEVTVGGTFDGVVFDDDFGTGVAFTAFGGSVNNVTVDNTEAQAGSSSLRIEVPDTAYTGGALAVSPGLNATGFNAVTFWARADSARTLNVAGIGNDGADTTLNTEITSGLPLTTTWTQYTIPIPDASVLTAQTGLFHFAEGSDEGAYVLWLDEIRYVNVAPGTITNPRATIAAATTALAVAETAAVGGVVITYNVGGSDVTLQPAAPAFLTYASSNDSVATVDTFGVITAVAAGMATITASIDGVAAEGTVMVNVGAGCSPTGPNLAVNGDFETGDFSCVQQFLNGGTQSITTTNPQAGTFAANIVVTVPDTDTVIKFANLTPGDFTAGETIHISFDMRGSVEPGGVVFAEFFSEIAGGGTSSAEILFDNGPIFPNADAQTWTNFRTTTVAGSDTTGGVSLQLKALSGGGNLSDIYFDNVCVSKSPCP